MKYTVWKDKKIGVVIVAGGSGSRMGADVPKQFLRVGEEPILALTVRKWLPYADRMVVVLPAEQQGLWGELTRECGLVGTHSVCTGGATRYDSVRSGLGELGECDIVAIHDGVRPLLSGAMIERGLECAVTNGSAIPTTAAVDSFRMEIEGELQVVNRSKLHAIQTPQIFESGLLTKAYEHEWQESFTDDATVVEGAGVELHYYEGERGNLKITTPIDLIIAEAIIKSEIEN